MKIRQFRADRSGAVVSEFVVLTAALVLGVSATLTTLTTSLGLEAGKLGSEISLTGCNAERATGLGTGALARSQC